MKPRMAIALLLATAIGVTLSHLEVQATDHGFLLDVDGRPVDVQGWWSDTLNGLQRDCARVQRVPVQDAQLTPALRALQEESPPASLTARITGAWMTGTVTGTWLLVQAEFDELLPAVVLMQSRDGGWTVVPQGVWSGQTHPWRAGPLIRSYLQGRVPNAPSALLHCFEPQAIHHTPPDAGPL